MCVFKALFIVLFIKALFTDGRNTLFIGVVSVFLARKCAELAWECAVTCMELRLTCKEMRHHEKCDCLNK